MMTTGGGGQHEDVRYGTDMSLYLLEDYNVVRHVVVTFG
jgi:hypothetical protein